MRPMAPGRQLRRAPSRLEQPRPRELPSRKAQGAAAPPPGTAEPLAGPCRQRAERLLVGVGVGARRPRRRRPRPSGWDVAPSRHGDALGELHRRRCLAAHVPAAPVRGLGGSEAAAKGPFLQLPHRRGGEVRRPRPSVPRFVLPEPRCLVLLEPPVELRRVVWLGRRGIAPEDGRRSVGRSGAWRRLGLRSLSSLPERKGRLYHHLRTPTPALYTNGGPAAAAQNQRVESL
mmetsp:Transcript_573/g.1295  ORF Transcript_573/g.1295 Transcript_573/m.1295 type:complete len:231 (+) Transcript_573:1899-2591(+)